jgi:hypothetical protein
MVANPHNETISYRFKLCLIVNFVSILLMFASAVITGYVSRLYGAPPTTAAAMDGGWLVSTYWIASRMAFIVGLPAFAFAFFGLLNTKLWARRLFTGLIVLWGLQAMMFGVFNLSMTWGLSALFANLALLTAGAVLAISYLTPWSDKFTSGSPVVKTQSPSTLIPA